MCVDMFMERERKGNREREREREKARERARERVREREREREIYKSILVPYKSDDSVLFHLKHVYIHVGEREKDPSSRALCLCMYTAPEASWRPIFDPWTPL